MRVAVIGMGKMGSALGARLLDRGHSIEVWNRTPGRAAALIGRGAKELASPDDIAPETDAIFVCSADDASVLDLALPGGEARPRWVGPVVAILSTVSPNTLTHLGEHYGDRLVGAPIMGAPQAVASGEAVFVLGGAPEAREELQAVWDLFAGPLDAGPDPARAAVLKLLNNQLLVTGTAMLAETVRAARAAGIDDDALAAFLGRTPTVPPALHNRIAGLFDPQHAGWFPPRLGAKDLGHFLDLASDKTPLPVTTAARDAYVRLAAEGWENADITALVELGLYPTG